MKENCKQCRYTGTAVVKETGERIDNWCRIKDRTAPKNPCGFWRPKARKEEADMR
jgi:hypothetical protein